MHRTFNAKEAGRILVKIKFEKSVSALRLKLMFFSFLSRFSLSLFAKHQQNGPVATLTHGATTIARNGSDLKTKGVVESFLNERDVSCTSDREESG